MVRNKSRADPEFGSNCPPFCSFEAIVFLQQHHLFTKIIGNLTGASRFAGMQCTPCPISHFLVRVVLFSSVVAVTRCTGGGVSLPALLVLHLIASILNLCSYPTNASPPGDTYIEGGRNAHGNIRALLRLLSLRLSGLLRGSRFFIPQPYPG